MSGGSVLLLLVSYYIPPTHRCENGMIDHPLFIDGVLPIPNNDSIFPAQGDRSVKIDNVLTQCN